VLHSPNLYLSEEGLKRPRFDIDDIEVSAADRPPKLRKVVREASHALRGVTNGSLWVESMAHKIPCLVICDSFSSWLVHVPELGYRVDQVLVKSPCHVNFIHKICGDSVPVWCGTDLVGVVAALSLHKDVTVCFLDGRITAGLLAALAGAGLEEVILTQTPRRCCQGWHTAFIVVPHSEVGGVTTRVVTIVRHSKALLSDLLTPLEVTAQRDAATVLSHATFGRYFRSKPESTVVDPLRCLNLGTLANPFYHGHGWLPGVLTRGLRVLTPVLNSMSHGGQWGLRTISSEEILLCNDIGSSAVSMLLPDKPNRSFYSILLPGKCLLAGVHSLFNGGGSGSKRRHDGKISLGATITATLDELSSEEEKRLGVKRLKFTSGSTIEVKGSRFTLESTTEGSIREGMAPLDPLSCDHDVLAREKR
jgi:hypothetical protein